MGMHWLGSIKVSETIQTRFNDIKAVGFIIDRGVHFRIIFNLLGTILFTLNCQNKILPGSCAFWLHF